MRRFLTLVCLLGLALPAGISISGCIRNPQGNYCNGLGYGLKDNQIASLTLQPQTAGFSLAYGQTAEVLSPQAFTCKGDSVPIPIGGVSYGTSNSQLADISPGGTSAPARGTATPAAASPTTPIAILPIRCHPPTVCPTALSISRPRQLQYPQTPSPSSFTRRSLPSIWLPRLSPVPPPPAPRRSSASPRTSKRNLTPRPATPSPTAAASPISTSSALHLP